MRILAERRGGQHLPLLLECAATVLVDGGGAADQDHRPGVLLGVCQAGERVNHTWPGDDSATLRTAGEVAGGLSSVGCRLLVAHAYVGNPLTLRPRRKDRNREAHHPEDKIDALLLQRARQQGRAIDRRRWIADGYRFRRHRFVLLLLRCFFRLSCCAPALYHVDRTTSP